MKSQADLVRDYIVENVLTGHVPAILFDESAAPFTTTSNKVVHVRQDGRTISSFTREHDCQVSVFSVANGSMRDLEGARDDAQLAAKALFDIIRVVPAVANSFLTEDVTGPYMTSTNRFYYRFTIRVLSEF